MMFYGVNPLEINVRNLVMKNYFGYHRKRVKILIHLFHLEVGQNQLINLLQLGLNSVESILTIYTINDKN